MCFIELDTIQTLTDCALQHLLSFYSFWRKEKLEKEKLCAIVPEKGITSRGLKITNMSLLVMGLFPLSIWLPLMSHVSTARTGASSLRLCIHVSAHIFSFYSGLSLYRSITFCCNSTVLFGNQMPLDWFVVRKPLMLIPQHSASRARNQSRVWQVPKLKSRFLGFSKHFTASHSQKFCTVSDTPESAFPRVKHAGRSQTLQGQREQNLLFGALVSLHEAGSDISCKVLLPCCSGLRTVFLLQAFHSFHLGVCTVIEERLRLCSFSYHEDIVFKREICHVVGEGRTHTVLFKMKSFC